MKRLLRLFATLLLLTFLQGQYTLAQGWEQTFGGNANDQAFSVIQTLDGGYATVGFAESNSSVGTNVILVKVDENGQEQWSQSFGGGGDDKGYEVVQDELGNYIIVGQTSSFGNGDDDVLLIKVDTKGREIWRKAYGGSFNDRGFAIALAQNGDYIVTGRTELMGDETANVYLLRINTDGVVLWERNFGGDDIDVGEAVIEANNGDIVVVGQNKSLATPNPASPTSKSSDVYFIKTDASGNILVEETYGNLEQEIAYDVVETSKGNFALTGVTTNKADMYLLMLDSEGKELWSRSYGGVFIEISYSIIQTADGGFVLAGFKEITASTSQMYLLKTDSEGNQEWDKLFGASGLDIGRSVVATTDGGFIVAGEFDINNDPERTSLIPLYDMFLVKTDDEGNLFSNIVRGRVHRDMNTNCEQDTDEKPLEDWLVRLRRGNEITFATTDADGNYVTTVEDGNYNVSLVVLNAAWEVCQNYNVAFTNNDTMQLNFAARSTVEDCPILVVDVSTALLEPCKEADYTISICNRGIETARDAYIDVQFDPYLKVNYSTLPWTNHVGNIYRFDIGDLVVEECGSFTVNTTVSCESAVGQAHCVEAYAHPDPICIPPPPTWDGASIKVDGECIGDSVQFRIRNIGSGNMGVPLGYVVIEDNLAFRVGRDIQLPSGAEDTIYVPVKINVSTYRLVAEQPAGHPYGETASAAVEGCPFGRPFNTGFLTAFSDADALPFFSLDCQENKIVTGNADLTASPKGVGTMNNIANTDELEFHIYFQNTGSDTVNRVIIRDTLSDAFDITTLVAGASSHTYDYEVSGDGILKFTFSNINLLNESESANESYGFVKFKIAQKRDNPTGMVIKNQATVLFDLGVPLQTNPTFHTIGGETVEDFVEISTSVATVFVPEVSVTIAPNPFDAGQGATVKLAGLDNAKTIQFDIYDVTGRPLQSQQYNATEFQFYPNALPQGLYIYTIRAEGQLVNSGKVFIK
ncbi:MAG: T9SS type A sorting domain-containing protein [Bacteroidota bacterium]